MTNPRNFLLIALLLTVFLLWQAWQKDYASVPAGDGRTTVAAAPDTASTRVDTPSPVNREGPDVPSAAVVPEVPTSTPAASTGVDAASDDSSARAARIVITTDVLRAEIDPRGGNLVRLDLTRYAYSNTERDRPVTLLDTDRGHYFVAQTGLVSGDGGVPDHTALFRAARTRYVLPAGAQKIEVPLTWQEDGVTVTKTWTFNRDSYRIGVDQTVSNARSTPVSVNDYGQMQRESGPGKRSFTDPQTYSFQGAAWWSPDEHFEKLKFDDYSDEPLDRSITDGWAALLQHHFVAALIPPGGQPFAYKSEQIPVPSSQPRYLVRALGSGTVIAPGATASLPLEFYIGPKLQKVLGDVAPGLNYTVDYGLVTVLAEPLFWMLSKIHSVVGNWGWAIVLLTVLIKLVFYKLSEAQYRSFARMRKFQPRLAALKERYGDDKEKLNRAMVELYQKEKINPMGGCLPMLVMFPVFIALYWVLIESVELRHAPWILWIHSLTDRDPYFVLPVLNGLTMYATQKLSPTSPGLDPMQQKMFQMMPVVMSVMFAFFPAGLVLYWTVNGLLGLIQQYVITKRIEASDTRH